MHYNHFFIEIYIFKGFKSIIKTCFIINYYHSLFRERIIVYVMSII